MIPTVARPLAMRFRPASRGGEARQRVLWSGFLLWGAGVALAVDAQHRIQGDVDGGRIMFGVAAVLAVSGMRLIDRYSPPARAEAAPSAPFGAWLTRRALVSTGLLCTATIVAAATAKVFADGGGLAPTASLWLISITLAVGGAAVGIRSPIRLKRPTLTPSRIACSAILIGIIGLALALRIPNLASVPPDVHGDEAAVGLDARALLHGGWGELFNLGWAGVPQLSYAYVAVVMRVFGDDLYGLRMASVLLGVVSLVLMYLVGRRLFSARIALVSAFVLAVAQFHIHFSRTGFHYMQAVPATLLAVHFMLRALETNDELDFVLAGMALGICEVVYFAGREIFPIVGVYLLYRIAVERAAFVRAYAVGLVCGAIGFLAFLAPELVTLLHHGGLSGSRAGAVWLFTHDNLVHERQAYGTSSTLHIVAMQTLRTVEAVNRTGETTVQWGRVDKPLFDLWSAALIVPGVAYAISRARRSPYLLLVAWLVVPMLACILAVDAPFSPHLIVALPAFALFVALVVDAGWRGAQLLAGAPGKLAFVLPVVAVAALALKANYHQYFDQQVKIVRIAGFYTLLGRYLDGVDKRDRVLIVSDSSSGNIRRYSTVEFLVPHLDGGWVGPRLRLPLTPPAGGKGIAVVIGWGSSASSTMSALTRMYPDGSVALHRDTHNDPEFFTYELTAAQLARPSLPA